MSRCIVVLSIYHRSPEFSGGDVNMYLHYLSCLTIDISAAYESHRRGRYTRLSYIANIIPDLNPFSI